MSPEIQQAAELIFNARRNRQPIARLSPEIRPTTKEKAFEVQQAVTGMLQRPILAWKCSLPRPDRIPCAPIFDVFSQGKVDVINGLGVEPEVAFVLGRDLPTKEPPYSEDEIAAAISEARLAVEVIGSRFIDYKTTDIHERVSDHIINESLIVGPKIDLDRARALNEFKLTLTTDNADQIIEAKHPEGGPFGAFAWLANFAPGGLKKGCVITTGSYAGIVEVPINSRVRMQYGDEGEITFHLTPAKSG